ncbi:MAG: hypothetical protein K8U57_04030 [Planctomycetes bacterium]|nr:hypothetical protein [Planctomycetota bacterium]
MGTPQLAPLSDQPIRSAWDWVALGIVCAAASVAFDSAIPFAGGYSDGSRLAAIESLGGRNTFVIDDSVFVGYQLREGFPPAYDPAQFEHLSWGTNDKMFVQGHFYSHHPPIPLIPPGMFYRAWLMLGGPSASDRPDLFVFWITFTTAGLPYVFAVWCIGRLARDELGLSGGKCALLTLSFAAATIAPAYSRQVNGHILLLAVGALTCLLIARAERIGTLSSGRLIGLGTVAGMGYCLDGALGPALLICVFGYILTRKWKGVVLAGLALAPWLIAHHGVLYAISGNPFSPASDPNNWKWPGSPFNPQNLTGVKFKHTPLGALDYLSDLLVGQRGFLSHNLPLALAPAAATLLFWRYPADRRAVAVACGWVLIGASPYVLTSNNYSGSCLSVRWFIPFLAPGFWLIGMLLRRRPNCIFDLAWLTACGLILGHDMLLAGPWKVESVPNLYFIGMLAAIGWGILGVIRTNCHEQPTSESVEATTPPPIPQSD